MTIASIIRDHPHDVISATVGMPVSEVVTIIATRRIGAVPVIEDGVVKGIMSERDILYRLASDGPDILSWPVEKVMTSPVITVESEMGILTALSLMTQRRFRHLPVVDGGRLVGFVSIGDLVKARIDRIEEEANAMRDYIQSA